MHTLQHIQLHWKVGHTFFVCVYYNSHQKLDKKDFEVMRNKLSIVSVYIECPQKSFFFSLVFFNSVSQACFSMKAHYKNILIKDFMDQNQQHFRQYQVNILFIFG